MELQELEQTIREHCYSYQEAINLLGINRQRLNRLILDHKLRNVDHPGAKLLWKEDVHARLDAVGFVKIRSDAKYQTINQAIEQYIEAARRSLRKEHEGVEEDPGEDIVQSELEAFRALEHALGVQGLQDTRTDKITDLIVDSYFHEAPEQEVYNYIYRTFLSGNPMV